MVLVTREMREKGAAHKKKNSYSLIFRKRVPGNKKSSWSSPGPKNMKYIVNLDENRSSETVFLVLFKDIENLALIVPSETVTELVDQKYLGAILYPVLVKEMK